MGGGREIAVGVTRDLIGRDCCRSSRAGVRLGAWIWRNRRRGEDLWSAYSFPGRRSLWFSWECLLGLSNGLWRGRLGADLRNPQEMGAGLKGLLSRCSAAGAEEEAGGLGLEGQNAS